MVWLIRPADWPLCVINEEAVEWVNRNNGNALKGKVMFDGDNALDQPQMDRAYSMYSLNFNS